MGRCDFSRVGYGMTEREAYQDAIESARQERGHEEGYSGDMNSSCGEVKSKCIKKPKQAKRCKVEKEVQKGTRQWETLFIVTPQWESRGIRLKGQTQFTKQGDALKRAKELALETGETMVIDIEKRLKNGSHRIASVRPNNSERGAWRFSGEAMC